MDVGLRTYNRTKTVNLNTVHLWYLNTCSVHSRDGSPCTPGRPPSLLVRPRFGIPSLSKDHEILEYRPQSHRRTSFDRVQFEGSSLVTLLQSTCSLNKVSTKSFGHSLPRPFVLTLPLLRFGFTLKYVQDGSLRGRTRVSPRDLTFSTDF